MIDWIQLWKAIHNDIDLGHSDVFEYAINTRTRGHANKLSIPRCRKDVEKRSYAVKGVNSKQQTAFTETLRNRHKLR